jgi:copper(I)-binding protein
MQSSSAAYFTIRNEGAGTDTLLSVTSPAGNASLHSTSMDNGVMRMRPLAHLDVPANSDIVLKPGGTHVMLMGLKQPLAAGSTVELDLQFEKSGEKRLTVPVRPATATGEGM